MIDFGTKEYDSHGAVTTGGSWKFTAPVSGTYRIYGGLILNVPTSTRYNLAAILRKNGTEVNRNLISSTQNTSNSVVGLTYSFSVRLNAGDYIDIQLNQDSGASRTLNTNAGYIEVTEYY